ncbi:MULTISPECIES: hypothetical protein [unclassified Streptomyces]|uniref:hypothetical protein n=1 Tax=unclassified Streptomyces TaxID=2593676 RepID=UPI00035EEB37|nr:MULTISPECIES: hypothetical protein [unclassified Streptomyces]MYX37647.1 hypothetical protein [Streptomyces sp. SID8377]
MQREHLAALGHGDVAAQQVRQPRRVRLRTVGGIGVRRTDPGRELRRGLVLPPPVGSGGAVRVPQQDGRGAGRGLPDGQFTQPHPGP